MAIPTPPREELMNLRFVAEKTRHEIADHYNVSYATVRKWIRELNIPRPQKKEKKVKLPDMTSTGEIVVEADDGYSLLEKAKLHFQGRIVERVNYGYYFEGNLIASDKLVEKYRKEVGD